MTAALAGLRSRARPQAKNVAGAPYSLSVSRIRQIPAREPYSYCDSMARSRMPSRGWCGISPRDSARGSPSAGEGSAPSSTLTTRESASLAPPGQVTAGGFPAYPTHVGRIHQGAADLESAASAALSPFCLRHDGARPPNLGIAHVKDLVHHRDLAGMDDGLALKTEPPCQSSRTAQALFVGQVGPDRIHRPLKPRCRRAVGNQAHGHQRLRAVDAGLRSDVPREVDRPKGEAHDTRAPRDGVERPEPDRRLNAG